jgi:hypothetical protein
MEEKSLIRLVRRNWVNIWSIKSIIRNIGDVDGKLETFLFGKDKKKDMIYLKSLRKGLPKDILNKLGINKISNDSLMGELGVLNKGVVEGSPRIEIIKNCVKNENDNKPRNCPPAKIKEIVKEIYVETCEGKETNNSEILNQKLKCGVDECLDISKEYCDSKMASMQM